MGTIDSNGIYFYATSDAVSPLQTLLNTGQASVSNAVEDAKRSFYYAANNTARDALLTAHGSSSTNPFYVDVVGVLWRHNGTTWTVITYDAPAPFRMASGLTSLASGGGPVVFPAARFTVPPIVTTQGISATPSFAAIGSVSATGFTGYLVNNLTSGATIAGSLMWTAVQMTPTSAAG